MQCPCQLGLQKQRTAWSTSFISSINEKIPLKFSHMHLAQQLLNAFNTSPLAWMELGRCDKRKALFVSFPLLQSPKIVPWSSYLSHCLNWKPYFPFPWLTPKAFLLSSEDFIAFKGCGVISLTTRSEVCGSIYKRLVWEEEERLHEIGSFCQARLVGNVFPNEAVDAGALLCVSAARCCTCPI